MSNIGSYPARPFKESQKFLVLDPATGTTSQVLGSDIVNHILPTAMGAVRAISTRAAAEATDFRVGTIIQTAGRETPGDFLSSAYLVVPEGEGNIPMINGNELLALTSMNGVQVELFNSEIERLDAADAAETAARIAGDYAESLARAEGDANLQAQLTGNVPLEASAFSPISWHDQDVSNSVTIPDNKNAWSFGPTMTIAAGQTVTVGAGSHWTIANGELN